MPLDNFFKNWKNNLKRYKCDSAEGVSQYGVIFWMQFSQLDYGLFLVPSSYPIHTFSKNFSILIYNTLRKQLDIQWKSNSLKSTNQTCLHHEEGLFSWRYRLERTSQVIMIMWRYTDIFLVQRLLQTCKINK